MHRLLPSPLARLSLFTLLTAVLLPAFGGCSSSPREQSGAADRAVEVAGLDVVALRRMGLQPRWISSVTSLRPDGITSLGFHENAVSLIEGRDNLITVLDPGDGSQRFKQSVGLPGERLYGAHEREEELVFNSGNRVFQLDARSGDVTAVESLDRTVNGDGVLRGDFLLFGAANGRLIAHSLVSGRLAWDYQMSGQIATAPLLVGQNVFAADLDGTYGLFDGRDGNALWRSRTFGQVTAEPVVAGSAVLVPSEDRTLYALDQTSGDDLWVYRTEFPIKASPHVVGDTIYLPAPGAVLIALWGDGTERWRKPLGARPLMAGSRGVYAHNGEELLLLDPSDGEILARTRIGSVVQATTTEGGSLLMCFSDGRVVRFDPTG